MERRREIEQRMGPAGWLPRSVHLRLTQYEAGFLHSLLAACDNPLEENLEGVPEPVRMADALAARLLQAASCADEEEP